MAKQIEEGFHQVYQELSLFDKKESSIMGGQFHPHRSLDSIEGKQGLYKDVIRRPMSLDYIRYSQPAHGVVLHQDVQG